MVAEVGPTRIHIPMKLNTLPCEGRENTPIDTLYFTRCAEPFLGCGDPVSPILSTKISYRESALFRTSKMGRSKASRDASDLTIATDEQIRVAAPADAESGQYEQRIAANPEDLEARYELAGALMARGERDRAADQLLEIVRRDREWNEGAARTRLLQLLEAIGLEDPWAAQQRRKLSAILFG